MSGQFLQRRDPFSRDEFIQNNFVDVDTQLASQLYPAIDVSAPLWDQFKELVTFRAGN